jgi:Flp pilus assembly protein TadD
MRRASTSRSLSQLYASRGDFARAAALLQAAITRDRPDVRALEQLASVAADAADVGALAPLVRRLEQIAPDSTAALFYAATLHALAGGPEAAVQAGEALTRRGQCHARCQNVLGVAYDASGRRHDARRAFAAAVEADPRDPAGYLNLAAFEMSAGNPAAAARLYAEALVIDPRSAAAQEGLRAARR